MADYQLTDTAVVVRVADMVFIPDDPDNSDRITYDAWLLAGGVPDPYEPPVVPPPTPPAEDVILFDHENRLRAIEGVPPLTLGEFRGSR